MPALPVDFDGIGKEALDTLLPYALPLLFPRVHAAIDWPHPSAFLLHRRDCR